MGTCMHYKILLSDNNLEMQVHVGVLIQQIDILGCFFEKSFSADLMPTCLGYLTAKTRAIYMVNEQVSLQR